MNTQVEQKHSGIGIASFILSLLIGVLLFMVVMFAGYMEVTTPGGISEESVSAIMLGLVIIGLLLLELVAFGLGIGGLFQKDRKKLFAILGTIFSGLAILGVVALMIIGSNL